MTGITCEEFTALIPYFQQCFDSYLHDHTLDGYERIGSIPRAYRNSPLPTIEDKMLFILVYLKQYPTQTV